MKLLKNKKEVALAVPREGLISRRNALFGLASAGVGAAAGAIVAGCGGGSHATTEAGRGAATLTIDWPTSAARLIPTAASSIAVSFLSGTTTVASQVVARPTSGNVSTVSFTSLPAGSLTLQAQAFPTSDGSGTAQAGATKTVTITAGSNAALAISMASTIDSLSIAPSAPSVSVGATTPLAASALDSSGAVVLTASSTISWISSATGVATVSSAGLVTGIAAGTATITATESESGKSATATVTVTAVSAGCHLTPTETDGPYPLYSVLSNSALIRTSIAETQTGVPLTVKITLVSVNGGCAVVPNAYVYVWHCNKNGEYSGYSSSQNGSHAGETFCRGIYKTDGSGQVTFTTIYPGWYTGRITHIHLQVYLSTLSQSTVSDTTQFGFPQDVTTAVYGSSLYSSHGQNTSVTSFSQDNVFSDGTAYQIATLTGSVAAGYTAAWTVGIDV